MSHILQPVNIVSSGAPKRQDLAASLVCFLISLPLITNVLRCLNDSCLCHLSLPARTFQYRVIIRVFAYFFAVDQCTVSTQTTIISVELK
jgi:hypothetical protein